MADKQGKKAKWPFWVGTLCIAAACLFAAHNYFENRSAQKQSEAVLTQLHELLPVSASVQQAADRPEPLSDASGNAGRQREILIPDYVLDPDVTMSAVEIGENYYVGTLYFPSLDLELPVMRSWSYANMRISPCLYAGSIYAGNAVIAAHNFESHFYALFSLVPGDTVRFTDVDGNAFTYEVTVQEVLDPTDVQEMIGGGFELSLFTCTLGGASRFTVRCRRL